MSGTTSNDPRKMALIAHVRSCVGWVGSVSRTPVLARLVLICIVAVLSLSGCVVIERRTPQDAPSGGVAGDPDVPTANPEPLNATSDRRLVGSLGWALLSEDVPNALVEMDQLDDARLSQEAIDELEAALRSHGRKQAVEIMTSTAEASSEVYSLEDLVRTSREHRDRSSGGDTVALHVLVLPGRFQTEGVPGAAFHATAIALFPQEIGRMLLPGAARSAFEAAVALHELGHAFGLVNRTGAGEFHEDPDHPGHTADEDSVMYWAIESPSLPQIFGSGPPRSFTDDDRREMDLIREQRP